MNSNFKIFLKGIADVSPLMIPVVPFGLIFGILSIDIGFSPLATMGMSLIIFGGASQIILSTIIFRRSIISCNYKLCRSSKFKTFTLWSCCLRTCFRFKINMENYYFIFFNRSGICCIK
jgi:hypothetical protein